MNALKERFRGCLVGALTGDALGSKFEGTSFRSIPLKEIVEANSVENLKKYRHYEPDELIEYTDDTAMTKAMCRSLITIQGFNQRDMAKMFTDEFYNEGWRGYGSGIVTVFKSLHDETFADITLPAQRQFNGKGSYGDGAAMRVAPVALFANDFETLKQVAVGQAMITHTHKEAIHGAILQAAAIHKVLEYEPPEINNEEFLEHLKNVSETVEKVEDMKSGGDRENESMKFRSYLYKFEKMKELQAHGENLDPEEAIKFLGNGISAYEAVPAAIFSFIHTSHKSFEESINFAISLGGDTDTIASMCGAIAGAFWGIEHVPCHWINALESADEMKGFADALLKIRENSRKVSKC